MGAVVCITDGRRVFLREGAVQVLDLPDGVPAVTVRVGVKQTIQPKPYHSLVVECSIEMPLDPRMLPEGLRELTALVVSTVEAAWPETKTRLLEP